MNKKKKDKQEFNTFSELIEKLSNRRDEYKKLYFNLIDEYKKDYNNRWLNDGGCKRCMGFKFESELEVKNNIVLRKNRLPCNLCGGKNNTVNLAYAHENNISPHSEKFQEVLNKLYGQIFKEFMNSNLQVNILEKYNRVDKDKLVVVTRGRKFEHGLKGKVISIFPNQYGSTTVMKSDAGKEIYIDTNNIDVLNCDENKF